MNLYRYVDRYFIFDEEGDRIEELVLIEYKIIKETPQGYWILADSKRKWVQNTGEWSKKRFAYKTKEEALNYFIYRKISQASYLRFQLKRVERALKYVQKNKDISSRKYNRITIFDNSYKGI